MRPAAAARQQPDATGRSDDACKQSLPFHLISRLYAQASVILMTICSFWRRMGICRDRAATSGFKNGTTCEDIDQAMTGADQP
jgi:hypothetical protein